MKNKLCKIFFKKSRKTNKIRRDNNVKVVKQQVDKAPFKLTLRIQITQKNFIRNLFFCSFSLCLYKYFHPLTPQNDIAPPTFVS